MPRTPVAIALGSNLGDRQANVAAALSHLGRTIAIDRVSSAYATAPVGYADQPEFINLACTGTTDLAPHELHEKLRTIERIVGRRASFPLGPRAIDLDLLLFGDVQLKDATLTIPHHGLSSRPFVLVPLAEIAPKWIDPDSGRTISQLASTIGDRGVRKIEGTVLPRVARDVQEMRPSVALPLDRAGVTGVKTLISLGPGFGRQRTAIATLDIYADLDAAHSGVHMSRFSQDLEDALAEVTSDASTAIDELALALAKRVVESQRARASEVGLRAEIALPRDTPASALSTHEFYTLIGRAAVAPGHERRVIGVEVQGITACPCAQELVAERARERLAADGFDAMQIERALAAMPIATHNQRGIGTLLVGCDETIDIAALVEIVEQSMSSETYDLLKRPDELFVVEKAHRAPRFVEDVVREMLRYVADAFPRLPDDAFVFAKQVNLESIHKHDAVAQTSATLGQLRRELSGAQGVGHTTLERWLYPSAARAR